MDQISQRLIMNKGLVDEGVRLAQRRSIGTRLRSFVEVNSPLVSHSASESFLKGSEIVTLVLKDDMVLSSNVSFILSIRMLLQRIVVIRNIALKLRLKLMNLRL